MFDRPVHGREFFEEVIRENLDFGGPERVHLLFERKITRATPGKFATHIVTQGVAPSLHISYKSLDLKQYFKEGRGLRTEGTINNPEDFGVGKRLENLPHLRQILLQINQRLLEVEQASQNCRFSQQSMQRLIEPTLTPEGQKAPGLKFGQPRVMALLIALCSFLTLPAGFHWWQVFTRNAVAGTVRQTNIPPDRISTVQIACQIVFTFGRPTRVKALDVLVFLYGH